MRVKQICEDDFKRWKYQAITKRDECSEGKITVEEYIDWMESSFSNRPRKKIEKTPVGPERLHSGPTGVFFDYGIATNEKIKGFSGVSHPSQSAKAR